MMKEDEDENMPNTLKEKIVFLSVSYSFKVEDKIILQIQIGKLAE